MSNIHKFKTTNIRGKQYVEVNERIKFFRQEEQYKNWSIITDFPSMDDAQCVCKASIVDSSNRIIATGHAHETQGSSNINKTSYVENCETSAIGRALAMLGIGIDTSIASANEVEEAISHQDDNPPKNAKADVKEPAKEPAKENVVDDIMGKSVNYIKGSDDKQKAYDLIVEKYGSQLTSKQVEGLNKFVR